jgi:hypothetical protein
MDVDCELPPFVLCSNASLGDFERRTDNLQMQYTVCSRVSKLDFALGSL